MTYSERGHMRSKIFTAAILFASLAQAKEPKHHQTGTLRTAHNMTEIPPEVADKVRSAIRDEAA
jgi:hypothetical protein